MAIENIGLVAVTENAARKVAVKAGGKIKAESGTKYLLQADGSDIAPENVTVKRAGKDLQVFFEGSDKPDLTIANFFAEGMDSQLYGVAEDGQLYAYVRTDGEGFYGQLLVADGESASIALGGDALADGAPYLANGLVDAAGFALWPWLAALAGVGAATAAIIHHNRQDSHKTHTTGAPANTVATDDVGPIQGQLHNGDVTDDAHPEISGNGIPGATIHVYDNGQEIGTAIVAADGTWSFTPDFADGAHSIDITQQLPGEKPSAPINIVDIVVDTTPPAAPSAEIEGAKIDGDNTYSNDDIPTIHGKGEPGDTIIIVFPTGETVTTAVDANGDWVAPAPTQPLPEGSNDIQVIEQDPAGNQTAIVIPLIIDTIAPTAQEVQLDPASDTGIKGDDITSDTLPIIDGKTEPGADVIVTFPTGEEIHTKADENGDWSVTPTQPLPEGNNDITIIATDAAGNQSEPAVITVVVDTVAPTAPEAKLDPSSDSGIKGDDITNDNMPTIDGKTEPGAEITVTFPTGEIVTATADDDGNWSVTPTQPLPEGSNDITVVATDLAGNQSEPTTISVVIDTQAPAAPEAWLDPASDSGVKGDNITSDTTPTIDGKTEPGSDVTVTFPTGEEIHAKADENGDWSVTPTQPLPEGNNDISVVVTDPAGNQSEPGVLPIVIESIAPSAPTIDSVVNNDDPAHLVDVPRDGSTNDTTPVISGGNAVPGDTIHVIDNGAEIGTAVVDPEGSWSFEVPADKALDEGEHDITVVAEDTAGNQSAPSQPYPIHIDTTAPSAPTIDSIVDNDDPAHLIDVPKDGSTNDTTPVISGGGAVPGDTIHVIDNGTEIGTAVVDPEGNWSFEVPADKALDEGEHDITVVAEDPAGNQSEPSQPYPIHIDTTAPNAPTIDSVANNDDPAHLIDVPKDGSTNDTTPVISGGGAVPGDTIHVSDNGTEIGTAVVDPEGNWSFEVPADKALDEGEHDITVVAEDPAGNQSEPSQPYPIHIDTTAPNAPTIDSVVDNDDPAHLIDVPKDGSTNDTTPVISGGGAEKGDIVHVFDGETELGSTVVANDDGTWSFEVPAGKALDQGAHDFTARAEDPAGNISEPSQSYPVNISTDIPGAPTIDSVVDNDDPAHLIDVPKDGSTNDTTPVISGGGAVPGDTIHVNDNGTEIGTAVVDPEGNWSFEVPADKALDEGEHDITVVAEDPAGNQSAPSQSYPIHIDTTAPNAPTIDSVVDNDDPAHLIDVPKDGSTNDTTPVISGGGAEKGDIVHVFDGETELGSTVVANDDGTWSFEVPAGKALDQGAHDFTAKAEDPAGNISEPSQPYPVNISTDIPGAPTIDSIVDNDDPAHLIDVPKDGSTNDTTPVISGGGAVPGDTIHVIDNGTEIGTAVVDPEGSWSFEVPADKALDEGEHDITVVAEDPAGNQSAPSQPYPIHIDTTAPNAPTIDAVVNNDDPAHLIDVPKDGSTNDTTPVISGGGAEKGDIIHVFDGETELGSTVVANDDGTWSFEVPAGKALDQGAHDFTAKAEDPAGNISEPSQPYPVNISTDIPGAPTIDSVVDNDDPAHLIDVPKDGSTNDTTPVISGGGAEKGAIIHVFDGETELGSTVVANDDGTWSFEVPADKALDEGEHDITVVAEDPAGNQSAPSQPYPIHIDTTAPSAPTIDAVVNNDDPAHLIDVPKDGSTNDTTPVISGGGAEKGDIIHVFDGETELGSTVVANDDGSWSFEVPAGKALDQGAHDFTARAEDPAGNISEPSQSYPVIIDTTPPDSASTQLTINAVAGDDIVDSVEAAGNVTISGKVTGEFIAGDKVSFVLDGSSYSADVSADGTWSVAIPGSVLVADSTRQIDATLVAHDAAGNAGDITASHSYQVQLNAVFITGMSKDSANDMAHSGDFITQDGGAGRGVYGTVAQALTGNQKVQVTFDGGATWKDAATNNLNWTAVDTGAHTGNWTIQARVVDGSVVQTDVASQNVTLLGAAGGAPTIIGIPDAVGAYTTDKAADGSDVNVSLAGTNAKAGDTLHIVWGDTTYDQVLTAGDIASGTVTANVPTQQTTTQGGQWDFAVTAQIVTPQGQVSLPSSAFQVHSQGWETLAIDDLNRNVTTFGSQTVYQGGGITITSNGTLTHLAATASGNDGLYFDNPSSGATTNYAQINFTTAVDSFSVNISSLQNTSGGSRVVVYDTEGNVLSDSNVLADGSGGVSASAKYSFTAPVGTDIGKVMIYGDGVNSSGAAGGGVVLDTLKFSQVHHVPGYNDTFTNEVGKATSGTGYHSDEGHFTLTSQGTVSVRSDVEHNLDGSYLYIGTGTGAISNSAAIFTFDQPVQSISYNLWGLETQQAIANNGSRLEVYDTNGALIFDRYVVNNGGSTYNYEQVSYTAPEGMNIGKAVVYQDKNGTLLDNFTTTLATSASSGQSLVDHGWETYYDGANATKELSWQGQSFAVQSFSDGTSLASYHSTSGTFTVTGTATKTASSGNMWANATSGSMFVAADKTAVITFDTARSTVEIGVTGIEPGTGNAAVMTVYSTDGTVLDTVQMLNPIGTYDIQSFSYESSSNNIGRIEITGDQGGTYVTHVSSSILSGGDIISMAVDPVAYFAQDGAHIHGSAGLDTLKLTGANQVLDLTRLIGDHDQGKIASIEKFDITGTGDNTLKISLNDVLNLGETNLFRADGKVQVMVDGDAGDRVELSNLHDHGTAPGVWQSAGTASIGGETYNVYSYSNLDAEILIKQAVTSTLV